MRPFWIIPALLLVLFFSLPVSAHDVKDPVCRMTTDTDTTPYRETVGGKTYYFCSAACQARFDKSPTAYLTLAQRLLRGRRTYSLTLTAPPHPVAGRPLPLVFAIHETPTGRHEAPTGRHEAPTGRHEAPTGRHETPTSRLVRDFEIVHQERLHLILVSADFRWFEHQHPKLGPDGRFRITWTFPRPGRYFLFTDFTPADGDNQILRAALEIGGRGQRLSDQPALSPDAGAAKIVRGTRITLLRRPLPMRAGRQTVLTYLLTDLEGCPRTDMQPILGVMGHLIALRDDGKMMVHTHALHGVAGGSYGAAMLAMMQAGQPEIVPVTPEMVTERGPRLSFKLTLPKPGRWKLWAQFQRQNQWLTVPFTVDIAPFPHKN